jgi:hypothetical protein
MIGSESKSFFGRPQMTDVHRIRVFDYVPSPIVSISINRDRMTLLVGRHSGYLEIWHVEQRV